MLQTFVNYLIARFDSIFLRRPNAAQRDQNSGEASRGERRDEGNLSLRE